MLCSTLFKAFYVTHHKCLRLNKRPVWLIEFVVKRRADAWLAREGVEEFKLSENPQLRLTNYLAD